MPLLMQQPMVSLNALLSGSDQVFCSPTQKEEKLTRKDIRM
jgi:hypothetical protein